MKLRSALVDARKALGALTALEAAALGYGLIDSAVAGYVTAGIGVATAGVVYLLKNESTPRPHPAPPP